MSLIIRKMTLSDKDFVIEMMQTFYTSPAVYTNGSNTIYLNNFNNCINENPYLEGYVFEVDGAVLGYSMLAKSYSTEFGKQAIWIEDIYLSPTVRNKGIATQFIQFVFSTYPNAAIRLEVEDENVLALATYKKNGFSFLPYKEMIKL